MHVELYCVNLDTKLIEKIREAGFNSICDSVVIRFGIPPQTSC